MPTTLDQCDDEVAACGCSPCAPPSLIMHELFLKFLESPARDSFLAVRAAVVASDRYDPYSHEIGQLNELLHAGKLAEAREVLLAAMPNLLLSARAHLALAYIARQLGDENGAQAETFAASACCEGILLSGEGTRQNPYLACRTCDEYDVLEYLDKKFQGQSLVEEGERRYDCMRCADGAEIWFDITDAYATLQQRFGK